MCIRLGTYIVILNLQTFFIEMDLIRLEILALQSQLKIVISIGLIMLGLLYICHQKH